MEAREVVTYIRDCVEVAQQVRGVKPQTIIEELEAESEYALKVIQEVIDGMAKQRRLWLTNDMTQKLEDPAFVFGGKYNRERWQEIKALFDNFSKWVEIPILVVYADTEKETPEIAIPPIVTVSRRGNPAPLWGVKQPEPEVIVPEPLPEVVEPLPEVIDPLPEVIEPEIEPVVP